MNGAADRQSFDFASNSETAVPVFREHMIDQLVWSPRHLRDPIAWVKA